MPRCKLVSLAMVSMSSIWITLAIYQLLSCSFLGAEALKFKIPKMHHGRDRDTTTTEAHHTTAHHDTTTTTTEAPHTTTHHPATTPHEKSHTTTTHHPGTTPHGEGHTTHHETTNHHTTPHHGKVKPTSKGKPKPKPRPKQKPKPKPTPKPTKKAMAKATTVHDGGTDHHSSYPLSTTEEHHDMDKGRKHGPLWVSDMKEMLSFAEANDTCSTMGGALVTIITEHDQEKVEHVLRHVAGETPGAIFSFWVGASHRYRYDGREGDFWSDPADTPVSEHAFVKNDTLLGCHEFGAYTVAFLFQEIYLCRRDESLSCRYICRLE